MKFIESIRRKSEERSIGILNLAVIFAGRIAFCGKVGTHKRRFTPIKKPSREPIMLH
jgi:hypothetical protein